MSARESMIVGVVGAGAMGRGIAQSCLAARFHVVLQDLAEEALGRATADIRAGLQKQADKGIVDAELPARLSERLSCTTDLRALGAAGLVIEAVVERLGVKQALFSELEAVVPEDSILATNTSSLSVSAIASGCRNPSRICGLHFFNPVPLMKLVEVVAGASTAPEVIERALAFCRQVGKVAVSVPDRPGFLVNLGGRAYTTEALHVQAEGVAGPAVIDAIMRDTLGFRMGPFELMDLTGIDVNLPATLQIWQGYQYDPRLETTPLHHAMHDAGRFGRKSGRGFHEYGERSAAVAEPPTAHEPQRLHAFVPEWSAGFQVLADTSRLANTPDDGECPILVTPWSEDALTRSVREGFELSRVVAIDFLGVARKALTLMTPVGPSRVVAQLADSLRAAGWKVAVIKDSTGFVAPRIAAMIANLGCEMAQAGIGSPEDIDLAMKLGLNYPQGPFEIVDLLGAGRVLALLCALQEQTGSDRYRPSLWLRRRVLAGVPIRTPS